MDDFTEILTLHNKALMELANIVEHLRLEVDALTKCVYAQKDFSDALRKTQDEQSKRLNQNFIFRVGGDSNPTR